MSSVFVLIAEALVGLCAASPAMAGGRIWRDRLTPVVAEHDSAIVVGFGKTMAQRADVHGGPTDWFTDYEIDLYKRAAGNEIPTDAVDPLLVELFARLSGAGPALGLGVEDVLPDPRITWDLGDGQTALVCATVLVRVIHRTQAAHLVAWP